MNRIGLARTGLSGFPFSRVLGGSMALVAAGDSFAAPVIQPSVRVQLPASVIAGEAAFISDDELVVSVVRRVVDATELAGWVAAALLVVLMLVLVLVRRREWFGRRGRIAGAPYCRKCWYELSGRFAWPSDPSERAGIRCPECGADVSRPRSVVSGARRTVFHRVRVGAIFVALVIAVGLGIRPETVGVVLPGGRLLSSSLQDAAQSMQYGRVQRYLSERSVVVLSLFHADALTGELRHLTDLDSGYGTSFAVSHDGRRVFVQTSSGVLGIDSRSGAVKSRTLDPTRTQPGLQRIVPQPSGPVLVPSSPNRTITLAVLAAFPDGRMLVELLAPAMPASPADGRPTPLPHRTVVVEMRDGNVVREVAWVPAHRSQFGTLTHRRWAWVPGGGALGTLVSASGAGEVRVSGVREVFVFDVASGELVREHRLTGHDDLGWDASRDGHSLYAFGVDHGTWYVRRVDLESGVSERLRSVGRSGRSVWLNAGSPAGVLLRSDFIGGVEVLDAATGDAVARLAFPSQYLGANVNVHSARPGEGAVASPGGSRVAAVLRNRRGGLAGTTGDELVVYELP